jgi:OmcA/MtrC family decaheme c-type cytochrome
VKDAATNTYEVVLAKSTFSVNTGTLVVTNGHSLAVPADAKMVTAVMSDGYALTLAALPAGLSADDAALNGAVPGIPSLFTATGNTPDGKPNVGRRVVMDVGKCNNCHDRLGSHPFFHTGNYATDMGPTVDVSVAMCAICHTPNQGGSTGWSANTRVWVHGIHSANTGIRTVPFTWHGTSPTNNYYTGMTFPGVIQNCAACHFVNADGTTTYDFSDPQYTDALITSMLNVVANTGKKNPAAANAWIFPQQAPIGSGVWAYGIAVDNTTDYGKGYSFDTSGTATNGQVIADATTPNNLVSSPITAACASCHDDIQWTNHMKTMGGQFYDVRGAKQVYTESCLTCHGPGTEWNIKDMHAKSLP